MLADQFIHLICRRWPTGQRSSLSSATSVGLRGCATTHCRSPTKDSPSPYSGTQGPALKVKLATTLQSVWRQCRLFRRRGTDRCQDCCVTCWKCCGRQSCYFVPFPSSQVQTLFCCKTRQPFHHSSSAFFTASVIEVRMHWPGNTKGGSITVLLISCLTGLELAVW